MKNHDISVLFWGTYDKGKPRNRILIKGLLENGVHIRECHIPVWEKVEDKSQIRGMGSKIYYLRKLILAYPVLIYRFLLTPRPDVVVIGYLGHLDVLVLWLFAKIRKAPIVWDAFLSLYDTVVCDRKLLTKNNPISVILYWWEWLACRAANRIILDTQAHADYFSLRYNVPGDKIDVVFVGVEPENFPVGQEQPLLKKTHDFVVLFYGQFIPLHGIETIIRAAKLLAEKSIQFVVVGDGQEAKNISELLEKYPLYNLSWIRWIDYSQLQLEIQKADVCLGIFGKSEKAARVIPNKVFQILHSGKPLITRDSPAIRELLNPDMAGIYFVPADSPDALANAIQNALNAMQNGPPAYCLHAEIRKKIIPRAIGSAFYHALLEALD